MVLLLVLWLISSLVGVVSVGMLCSSLFSMFGVIL